MGKGQTSHFVAHRQDWEVTNDHNGSQRMQNNFGVLDILYGYAGNATEPCDVVSLKRTIAGKSILHIHHYRLCYGKH